MALRSPSRKREAPRRRTRPAGDVSALRGEGHDVAVVGDALRLGAADSSIVEFARATDRVVLSEDADFRGADPTLDVESQPGVLVCDTAAQPGVIAAAVRRIDAVSDDLSGTVLFVPGDWV